MSKQVRVDSQLIVPPQGLTGTNTIVNSNLAGIGATGAVGVLPSNQSSDIVVQVAVGAGAGSGYVTLGSSPLAANPGTITNMVGGATGGSIFFSPANSGKLVKGDFDAYANANRGQFLYATVTGVTGASTVSVTIATDPASGSQVD